MMHHRVEFAARYFLAHLFLSIFVAAAVGTAIFFWVYPPPFSKILGVGNIFFVLAGVDVVLGPVLTAILADQKKTKSERILNFVVVGAVQFSALLYGVHSIWIARPAALVFEKDRFVLVRANEIYFEGAAEIPPALRLSPFGIVTVGTRDAANNEELIEGVGLAGQGITAAMRPSRWQPIPKSSERIKSVAKKLEILDSNVHTKSMMREARGKKDVPSSAKYYIPLTTSQSYDWIAILDDKFRIVGYLRVDGFL